MMNSKIKILVGILIIGIVLIGRWFILEYKDLTKPTKQINCLELDEDQCRNQSFCIPLGTSLKAFLETGGELETFVFEECVNRVPEYANCEEVVKMTQMYGGSKFPKECRCCCGEGPFCKERPYPEK